jgi:hypothetical protein
MSIYEQNFSAVKMEELCSYETLSTYKSIRHQTQRENRHRHHYDSFKYSIATCLLLSLTQVRYEETHLLLLFHKNVRVANPV